MSLITSDAGGNFNITGDYTCPSSNPLVYLTATGGNPGLTGNVNNTDLALMTVLGTCATLTSSTFVMVNELTTVAAVEALAPFMADIAHVGSDPSNPNGLGGAFASAAAMVSPNSGQAIPATNGVTPPTAQLNTLADILAACVNTAGGTSGDGTPCGKLLLYAVATSGSTTNTVQAMLNIAQSPAQNVAQLFALVGAQSPFLPTLPAAPSDWTLPVQVALPIPISNVGNYLMAIDTAQHIWVYTHDYTVDPITNATIFTGTITIYDNNGHLLHTISAGSGGLYFPGQLAADSVRQYVCRQSRCNYLKI